MSSSRSELRESDDEDNNNEQIDDDDALLFNQRSVFCQMDLLCDFEDGSVAWKEISRLSTFRKPHLSYVNNKVSPMAVRREHIDGAITYRTTSIALIKVLFSTSVAAKYGISTE